MNYRANVRVARALIERGIRTAPADAATKLPLTPHGFLDRSADAALVAEWAARWPGCLWMLVPADVGAVAFDVDCLTSRAIFERLGLATLRTYRTETPGGSHVAFRNVRGLTGGHPLSLADVGLTAPPPGGKPDDKLIVRIDRGYVIAPGCVRADGGRYIAHGRFSDMQDLPDAVAWLFEHAGDNDRRKEEPSATRAVVDPAGSVIGAFNRAHTVQAILEQNGYRRRGKRWVAPNSQTGLPGAVLLDGRAYSHHGSDPLADGHAHDAFDLYCRFDHRGDITAAVKAAAAASGIEHKRSEAVVRHRVRPLAAPTRARGSVKLLAAS